jgi:hypothetical protein
MKTVVRPMDPPIAAARAPRDSMSRMPVRVGICPVHPGCASKVYSAATGPGPAALARFTRPGAGAREARQPGSPSAGEKIPASRGTHPPGEGFAQRTLVHQGIFTKLRTLAALTPRFGTSNIRLRDLQHLRKLSRSAISYKPMDASPLFSRLEPSGERYKVA